MKNTTHHKGIHHITVIAGDPQRNAEFYVKTLGMRLIKKSVNQDDPGTYHLSTEIRRPSRAPALHFSRGRIFQKEKQVPGKR